MSNAADDKREYEAMLTLDDVLGTLRECGWSRDDLVERVVSTLDDLDADE